MLIASTAVAQTPSTTITEEPAPFEGATTLDTEILLNAPVITATGREQSRALAPANVVTWERDEIHRHGWTSLAEVLSNTPGLYVTDDLVLPQLGVRGVGGGLRSGTRIVRIMINGVPVNFRPDLTAFLGQEYIPFETVERIEIAKGPLSALYGANAFLATVNVITRVPNNGVEGEAHGNMTFINGNSGFGFGGRAGYGSETAHFQLAYNQATYDRSGITLDRTFGNQDPSTSAFSFFDGSPDEGFQPNPSKNDKTRPKTLYGSAELRSADYGIFSIQGGLQLLDSVAEFQPSSVLTHRSRVALRNNWLSAGYVYGYGRDITLSVTAGVSNGKPLGRETLFATGVNDFRFTRNFGYTALDFGAALEAKLPLQLESKTGVDFNYDREDVLFFTQFNIDQQGTRPPNTPTERIEAGADRTVTISNVGVYSQLGGNPFKGVPDLYVLGNIRYDKPNLFDGQLTWRGGIAYQFSPRVTSKLFIGRAFETPSAVQLFARPGFGSAFNIVGNRTISDADRLRVQNVFSTELATTVAVTNTIAIDSSIYYQSIGDFVEFEQITTNFTARNRPPRRFVGGELGLRGSSSRLNTYVFGSATARTYDNEDGLEQFGFRQPPELPAYTVYAGTTLRLPEAFMAVDVTARLVGSRGASDSNIILNNRERYTLPAYATFDLTLTSLDLFLFGEGAETRITANVKNVLDNRFNNPGYGGFDFPSVGRVFFFRLAQAF